MREAVGIHSQPVQVFACAICKVTNKGILLLSGLVHDGWLVNDDGMKNNQLIFFGCCLFFIVDVLKLVSLRFFVHFRFSSKVFNLIFKVFCLILKLIKLFS